MSGLIYKNFRVNRSGFIFSLITAGLCGITAILLAVFVGGADLIKNGADPSSVVLVYAILYYLAFMLPAMATSMLFEADENKTCCAFAMSCPLGGKGHIEAKYYYLLIVDLSILFISFISDTVATVIFNGMVSSSMALLVIFCWRILLTAVEVPFVIRFGSQRGISIKGAVIGFIFIFLMIYFLFGDISWLMADEDPVEAFMAWIQSGDLIFWAALFMCFCLAAFYVSCKISVRIFRKGAENYEQ